LSLQRDDPIPERDELNSRGRAFRDDHGLAVNTVLTLKESNISAG